MSDNLKAIENSKEFKAAMQKSERVDVSTYRNSVANKVANIGAWILLIGIIISFIGAFIVYGRTYELILVVKFILTMVIPAFISYIVFLALAEIIELLQSIKDK